jgi:peptide-methionine (S)-S-oxide reductase
MVTQKIYFAGGCLWGVQEFMRHLPGVISTEAGRANGSTRTTTSDYDGYAECVRVEFDTQAVSISDLMAYFFEIIDPYSINRQGEDIGEKYRTGVYSEKATDLDVVRQYINRRADADKIVVEIKLLSNYIKSDDEHQDRLSLFPDDYCHIPMDLLHKYRNQ